MQFRQSWSFSKCLKLKHAELLIDLLQEKAVANCKIRQQELHTKTTETRKSTANEESYVAAAATNK